MNAMPMQTALLGFALLRSIQHRLSTPPSPAEITIIEIVAGALGLAPFILGFTSLIPALEFLSTTSDAGSSQLSLAQLFVWSIATCAFGTTFAPAFKQLFILSDRLRFPSATATGTLIGVLFGRQAIGERLDRHKIHITSERIIQDQDCQMMIVQMLQKVPLNKQ